MTEPITTAALQASEPPATLLLPLGVLMPSPTNPRKRFAAAALEDLAATVAVHGVMQPLLARPNPAHTPGDGRAPWEIVAGERRWRACKLLTDEARPYPHAGQVPVIVRQLTDQEVLALQALENIQREDLHPLDEADHYWLMTTHPSQAVSVDTVAATIGKSPAYVYTRLGLRRLVTVAREAFLSGLLDTSKAVRVAAMPAQLQAEIVAHITTWGGEPMGTRAAERYIHDHYTLRLQSAPWPLVDAKLVPAAGACTSCTKRSDAQLGLFEGATEGDRCLDTQCWATKREAWRDLQLDEAQSTGYRVLRGTEADTVLPPKGTGLADGWIDLQAPVPAGMTEAPAKVADVLGQAGTDAQHITAVVDTRRDARDTLLFAVPLVRLRDAVRRAGLAPKAATPGDGPGAQPTASSSPSSKAAKAKPSEPAAPAWDPMDDMLRFAVLPNGRVKPEAVDLFRARAVLRTERCLLAHRVGNEVRDRGQALGVMLPQGAHSAWLLRLVGDPLHWIHRTPTLDDAARLAGITQPLPQLDAAADPAHPETGFDQYAQAMTAWLMGLDATDAACLAWVAMTLTDDAAQPLPGTTWRQWAARALGINPGPVAAQASQAVDERLRLELLTRAPAAKGTPRKPRTASVRTKSTPTEPTE